jgi:hypothetical protein
MLFGRNLYFVASLLSVAVAESCDSTCGCIDSQCYYEDPFPSYQRFGQRPAVVQKLDAEELRQIDVKDGSLIGSLTSKAQSRLAAAQNRNVSISPIDDETFDTPIDNCDADYSFRRLFQVDDDDEGEKVDYIPDEAWVKWAMEMDRLQTEAEKALAERRKAENEMFMQRLRMFEIDMDNDRINRVNQQNAALQLEHSKRQEELAKIAMAKALDAAVAAGLVRKQANAALAEARKQQELALESAKKAKEASDLAKKKILDANEYEYQRAQDEFEAAQELEKKAAQDLENKNEQFKDAQATLKAADENLTKATEERTSRQQDVQDAEKAAKAQAIAATYQVIYKRNGGSTSFKGIKY